MTPVAGLLLFGQFIRRRSAADAGLLAGVGLAVLIATVVIGGGPAYLQSLDRVGVSVVLDGLPHVGKNLVVTNNAVPSRLSGADAFKDNIDGAAAAFGEIAAPARRALRSPYHRNLDPATAAKWSLARFVLMDDFTSQVTFVDGRAPNDPGQGGPEEPVAETAILADLARDLGISAGDSLVLQVANGDGAEIAVLVSGTFDVDDIGGAFWMGLGDPLLRPAVLPGFPGEAAGLFVTPEGYRALASESAATSTAGAWIVDLDRARLEQLEDGEIVDAADGFQSQVEKTMPGSLVITGLERSFQALERRAVFARIPMFLMAAILLTIVAYYLLMAAGILAARRREEIATLRSRGISLVQLARLFGLEAAILVGAAVIAGPLLANVLIAQAGRIPPFDGLTGGGQLPVSLSWEQFALSAAAGVAVFAILVAPALLVGSGGGIVRDRPGSGDGRAPAFQRYFLDAALLVLAGFLVWELDARGGEAIRVDEDGGLSTDPTVFIAPPLVLLGASLIFLRVFPPAVRMAAALTARIGPAWMALAAWRLSRAPFFYAPVALLLMLASGLAVVAATLASTLEDSAEERVLYDSGADVRVTGARRAERSIPSVRSMPSVRNASAAGRLRGTIGTTASGPEFQLLAVESDRFTDVTWFRPDFSSVPLPELMGRISPGPPPRPVVMPGWAANIGIWTQTNDAIEHLFLWATVRDSAGIVQTVTFGAVERGDWRLQTASIADLKPPVELLSVQLFQPSGEDRATAGSILLDDVVALETDGGRREVVVDFDQPDGWTAFPTSEGLDARFTLVPEPPALGELPGSGVAGFTFGRGSDGGVRGIYRSPTGGPVPVVVSSTLAAGTGISEGVPFIARLSGSLTPLVAVGVADYFPTLDPAAGNGFMVADLGALAAYMGIKGTPTENLAGEMFVATAPGLEALAASDIQSIISVSARVEVRLDREQESLVDPLSVAGWRGVGLLAGVTTLVVVVLGFLTYLRAYIGKMNTEEAFIRSMGFGRPDYAAAAAVEHLLLGVVGIAIGAAAGLAMSGLAVDVSSRTSSGSEPLPPFILATSWESLAAGYGVLVAVAAGALAYLTLRYGRRALFEATRLET